MSETSSIRVFLSGFSCRQFASAAVPPFRPGAGARSERVILPKNSGESSHAAAPGAAAASFSLPSARGFGDEVGDVAVGSGVEDEQAPLGGGIPLGGAAAHLEE